MYQPYPLPDPHCKGEGDESEKKGDEGEMK
jgi:hypothetical protein